MAVDYQDEGGHVASLRITVADDCSIQVDQEGGADVMAAAGRMQVVLAATYSLPLALAAFFDPDIREKLAIS